MRKRMLCILNLLVFSICMLSAQAIPAKTTTKDTVKSSVKVKPSSSKTAIVAKKSTTATKSTAKTTPSVKTHSKAVTKSKGTTKAKTTSSVTAKTKAAIVPTNSEAIPTSSKPVVEVAAKGAALTPQSSASPIGFNNEMLEAVNALRKSGMTCGNEKMPPVKPLVWNAQLEKAAISHTNYMVENDILSHSGKNGTWPEERFKAAGYISGSARENIGKGYKDLPAVIKGWSESSGHCKNMMSADVTELGAAKKGIYWCQTYATPLE